MILLISTELSKQHKKKKEGKRRKEGKKERKWK